jgi:hypothetical protein
MLSRIHSELSYPWYELNKPVSRGNDLDPRVCGTEQGIKETKQGRKENRE